MCYKKKDFYQNFKKTPSLKGMRGERTKMPKSALNATDESLWWRPFRRWKKWRRRFVWKSHLKAQRVEESSPGMNTWRASSIPNRKVMGMRGKCSDASFSVRKVEYIVQSAATGRSLRDTSRCSVSMGWQSWMNSGRDSLISNGEEAPWCIVRHRLECKAKATRRDGEFLVTAKLKQACPKKVKTLQSFSPLRGPQVKTSELGIQEQMFLWTSSWQRGRRSSGSQCTLAGSVCPSSTISNFSGFRKSLAPRAN